MYRSYGPCFGRALALVGGGLLSSCILASCISVGLNPNGLDRNLPPAQAQDCRDAVSDALIEEGVSPQAVKNVDYQAVDEANPRSSNRLRGFEAWVYPQSGGALVVELSASCQVRDVRWLRES